MTVPDPYLVNGVAVLGALLAVDNPVFTTLVVALLVGWWWLADREARNKVPALEIVK